MAREIDTTQALRAFVAKHKTQRDAAKALGVSGSYLNDLIHGRREFSGRILNKLGLRRMVVSA